MADYSLATKPFVVYLVAVAKVGLRVREKLTRAEPAKKVLAHCFVRPVRFGRILARSNVAVASHKLIEQLRSVRGHGSL